MVTSHNTNTNESKRCRPAGQGALLTQNLLRDLLRGIDLTLIGLLGATIYFIHIHPIAPHRMGEYLAAIAAALLFLGLSGQFLGLYHPEVVFERRLKLGRAVAAWALAFALLLAAAFALKVSDVFSRVWAFSWFLTGVSALGLMRMILTIYIGRLHRTGAFANRIVILGTGPEAEKLAQYLMEAETTQIEFLGFIDDLNDRPPPKDQTNYHLGGLDILLALIREGDVDQVIISLPWQEANRINNATYQLALTPVTVSLAPDVAGLNFPGRIYVPLAGVPMLQLYNRPISGWSRIFKGLEDRILAVVFLIALAPLMVFIGLAIRLDSAGPVLFRQERYGFNNNLIEVLKFRTMYNDLADPQAEQLTTRNDTRVTRVGRFLRRTSLDELPQLFNVLSGEMSIVGPRPHAIAAKAAGRLYDEAVDHYAARHKVKPGITGWAQVNGWRGDTDTLEKLRKRIDYDLYYIDNWSVWFDLKIIVRTTAIVFNDRQAY